MQTFWLISISLQKGLVLWRRWLLPSRTPSVWKPGGGAWHSSTLEYLISATIETGRGGQRCLLLSLFLLLYFHSFFFLHLCCSLSLIPAHQHPHLAKTQKVELFIPSTAFMSAALGSNSQSDRLTAVLAHVFVLSVHSLTSAEPHTRYFCILIFFAQWALTHNPTPVASTGLKRHLEGMYWRWAAAQDFLSSCAGGLISS